MEQYQVLPGGQCNTIQQSSVNPFSYFRIHNPFVSFLDIQNNPSRCAKIVNGTQMLVDLKSGRLPQYSMYTPDTLNDGDTSLASAGQYLNTLISSWSPLLPDSTLIVVVFAVDDGKNQNHVYCAIYGHTVPGLSSGSVDTSLYNHYSLLSTVEHNFGLGTLGLGDANANTFFVQQNPGSSSHGVNKEAILIVFGVIIIIILIIIIIAVSFHFWKKHRDEKLTGRMNKEYVQY